MCLRSSSAPACIWVPNENMAGVAGPLLFPVSPVRWSCRRLLPWLSVESKHLLWYEKKIQHRSAAECVSLSTEKTQPCAGWQWHWHCTYYALPALGNSLERRADVKLVPQIQMMYSVCHSAGSSKAAYAFLHTNTWHSLSLSFCLSLIHSHTQKQWLYTCPSTWISLIPEGSGVLRHSNTHSYTHT